MTKKKIKILSLSLLGATALVVPTAITAVSCAASKEDANTINVDITNQMSSFKTSIQNVLNDTNNQNVDSTIIANKIKEQINAGLNSTNLKVTNVSIELTDGPGDVKTIDSKSLQIIFNKNVEIKGSDDTYQVLNNNITNKVVLNTGLPTSGTKANPIDITNYISKLDEALKTVFDDQKNKDDSEEIVADKIKSAINQTLSSTPLQAINVTISELDDNLDYKEINTDSLQITFNKYVKIHSDDTFEIVANNNKTIINKTKIQTNFKTTIVELTPEVINKIWEVIHKALGLDSKYLSIPDVNQKLPNDINKSVILPEGITVTRVNIKGELMKDGEFNGIPLYKTLFKENNIQIEFSKKISGGTAELKTSYKSLINKKPHISQKSW